MRTAPGEFKEHIAHAAHIGQELSARRTAQRIEVRRAGSPRGVRT